MSTKLMRTPRVIQLGALAALVAVSASCGDVVRSSRSPVMLVVNSLAGGAALTTTFSSDVLGSRTSPLPCSASSPCPTIFSDPGSATLGVIMKDVTVVGPSTNNSVTVNRYRIEYRRGDGHNTPGVDVPYPFDGAVTATIAPGSTAAVGFELVRIVAKEESPLAQLVNNPNFISTIATVTFFGADQVGNDVSASGTMLINFGNFADTP
jgi:hypothetical protein